MEWSGRDARKGGIEWTAKRVERGFPPSEHRWGRRAGAHLRFDFPPVGSGAIKDNLFGKLLSGESFDDHHGTSAVWTWPSRFAGFGHNQRGDFGGGEQYAAERQRHRALAVGEETETTDAHESQRQDVLQEAPEELVGFERHDALLTTMRVIFPAERHLAFGEVGDAVIGDRDAMGVAGEILQH